MALDKNSTANVLLVTIIVSLICSVIISTAAVGLRPLQEANKRDDIAKSILEVAGLYVPDIPTQELFQQVEAKIIELDTGLFVDLDIETFDMKKVAADENTSQVLSNKDDIANINTRPNYAKVYLIRNEGVLDKVVLPIYGYGLWSTLYGFIALEEDGNTVYGIKYYDHKETPGLGGEVDNPNWRHTWQGKKIYDKKGKVGLVVIRGKAKPNTPHHIDGLAGASLTSKGVSNMLRFWMGESAYLPFLERVKVKEII